MPVLPAILAVLEALPELMKFVNSLMEMTKEKPVDKLRSINAAFAVLTAAETEEEYANAAREIQRAFSR